jgi:hypothetical protein
MDATMKQFWISKISMNNGFFDLLDLSLKKYEEYEKLQYLIKEYVVREKEVDEGSGRWGYFLIEIDKTGKENVINVSKNLQVI